jgi:hypothetical protein
LSAEHLDDVNLPQSWFLSRSGTSGLRCDSLGSVVVVVTDVWVKHAQVPVVGVQRCLGVGLVRR